MLDRIIVGFDNSEMSRSAFAYATMIAESTDSEVVALHAIEPGRSPCVGLDPAACLEPMMPVAVPSEGWGDGNEQEREQVEGWFKEISAYCEDVDVLFSSKIVPGTLADALLGEAREGDLIAVGMAGRFKRGGIGSSTRDLVNHCCCPVMVVGGELKPVNRVLTAYDGTKVSRHALAFGQALAERAGWPMSVLGVGRGELRAEDASDQAAELAPGAQVLSLGEGDEAALIERFVDSDRYGLMVMGAYAESWMVDLLFGSTTGKVLSRLGAPVVLVHAPVESGGGGKHED